MRKFGWGLMMALCIAMAIYALRFLVLSPETLFPDSGLAWVPNLLVAEWLFVPRRVSSASRAKAAA